MHTCCFLHYGYSLFVTYLQPFSRNTAPRVGKTMPGWGGLLGSSTSGAGQWVLLALLCIAWNCNLSAHLDSDGWMSNHSLVFSETSPVCSFKIVMQCLVNWPQSEDWPQLRLAFSETKSRRAWFIYFGKDPCPRVPFSNRKYLPTGLLAFGHFPYGKAWRQRQWLEKAAGQPLFTLQDANGNLFVLDLPSVRISALQVDSVEKGRERQALFPSPAEHTSSCVQRAEASCRV